MIAALLPELNRSGIPHNLRRLNAYQLEGRYAEMSANAPISANTSSGIMSGAEEALRWLKQQL